MCVISFFVASKSAECSAFVCITSNVISDLYNIRGHQFVSSIIMNKLVGIFDVVLKVILRTIMSLN